METNNSEMLRGHIDTIVLQSLVDDDKHTNQIREEIELRAAGKFELKNGTFYSCLQRIVKQGYVTEYRTTSSDGVRRKFYQLTEKGKTYIDDNKDKWVSRRQLINDLIITPETTEETPANTETHSARMHSTEQEPFDVDKALRDFMQQDAPQSKPVEAKAEKPAPKQKEDLSSIISNSDNVKILTFDQIAFPEVSDIKPKEVKPEKQPEKPKVQPKKPTLTGNLDLATDPDTFDVITLLGLDNYQVPTKQNEAEKEVASTQIKEQIKEEKQEVIENKPSKAPTEAVVKAEPIATTTDIKVEPKEEVQPQTTQKVAEVEQKAPSKWQKPEEDDYYQPNSPIQHDYKNVLERLFPKQKPVEEPKKESVEIDYQEGMDINEFFQPKGSSKQPQLEQEKPVGEQNNTELISKIKQKRVHKQPLHTHKTAEFKPQQPETDGFDFSDVQAYAKAEGFKINVSNGATKRKINSIYTNKLNAISALIFFGFVVLELFLLSHFTATTAQVNKSLFIITGAIISLLPLTSTLIYLLEPKKRVAQIPTMKSIIEFISVIMLNLFLIVIVFAILSNVDFSSSMQLMRYVLYPTIVILNVPIYFIIKYLCLDHKGFYA